MARKQFVSSMKNAPSRAVSSKEAALQGRRGDLSDDDDDDAPRRAESPVSSAPSSPISSDEEDDDEDDDDDGKDRAHDENDEDPAEHEDAPVAVQVMPASVGRGKQLRFPTAISRGKEARILHNGSDRDGSDSESYASVASDEEEENDDEMQAVEETPAVDSPSKSPLRAAADEEGEAEQDEDDDDAVYPIKAFRARKRHRPDSGYFTQMSTHVRDCLLSIRDGSTAEALSEEAHHEFRRKLSAGTVERVPWKQVSPPPPAAAPSDSEKKVPKGSPGRESSSDKRREREGKDGKSSKSSSSRKSSVADERSDRRADKSSRTGDHDSADRKKERSGKENDSKSSTSRRDEKDSSRSSSDKKNTRDSSDKSKSTKSSSSSSSSSKRVEENGHSAVSKTSSAVCEDVLCAKCKKSVSEQNADEAKRKASVEAAANAAALQAAAAQATLDAAKATAAAAARSQAPAATDPTPAPRGTFLVPTNAARDIAQMREEAARLNDEARSLKHEGNRRGVADPGPEGQAAQGRYYLRSSAKFFEHALLLADIKAAYREANDERSARTYGNYSMQTLAQTSSLIESTVRRMRTAGNKRLVALGLKLTSIVELTIYRLQHVKLYSIYSNLNTTGRSPDSRQNGTTPPLNGSASEGQDSALKALLHKEMEHTLRGFEMWHQYETCRVEVLPRITNPAVVDLNVLFEDLATELGQS